MKKLSFAAAVAALALVSGCANSPQVVADFKTQVVKACAVVQPTLLSVQAMTADDPVKAGVLAQLITDNSAVCAAGASIDPTSVQALVGTSIPAAIKVLGVLPIDANVKQTAQLGLMAFQVALSASLAQYGGAAAQ